MKLLSALRGRERRRTAEARSRAVELDGLVMAELREGLRLLDEAGPGAKAVSCRRCGEALGVAAGPAGYATTEWHDVEHLEPDGQRLVGRSEAVIKTGRGVLIRRCRSCGHLNKIRRGSRR